MRDYKRLAIIFFLILLFVLLQSTFFHFWKILGAIPDLVILFIIMVGLYNGLYEGVLFGMISGVILGHFSSGYSGIFCLCYGISGFLAGLLRLKSHPDNFVIPIFTAIVLTFFSSFLVALLGLFLGIIQNFYGFKAHILPVVLINAILAIPMGYLARSRLITSRRPIL